jgi:hypothetical protein
MYIYKHSQNITFTIQVLLGNQTIWLNDVPVKDGYFCATLVGLLSLETEFKKTKC